MKVESVDKLFIIFLIVIAFLQWSLFADFQHIPGPLYGGDLYRERGFVQHILNGESYSEDPYFSGELEFYPPFGYVLAAKIVQWFSVDVEWVLSHFPIVVFVLVSCALYLLGYVFFQKKEYALLLVGVFTSMHFVMPKHTLGLGMGFTIFSLFFYVRNAKNPSWKNQAGCGIFLGLAGLTHYSAFLVASAMLAISTLLEMIYLWKIEGKLPWQTVFRVWLSVVIALTLSSVFLYPLYDKYSLATPNETQIYSLFNPYAHGLEWVFSQVWNVFFSGGLRSVLGIFAVIGLLFCIIKCNVLENRMMVWFFLSVIIAVSHFIVTIPLFDKSVVPPHLFGGMPIAFSLLVVVSIKLLSAVFEKKTGQKREWFLLVVGVVIVFLIYQQYNAYNVDQWVRYGRTMDPGTAAAYQIGDWILENTQNSDVFLAHDESSFALNVLTGRKLVMVRRTHASPYVDVDKRYADGFVMLYGSNETRIRELLNEYNVKYLYVDRFIVDTPMVTSIKFSDYLRQQGVEFQTGKSRYDPASTDTPLYDVVAVQGLPKKILNISTSQQRFMVGGQPFAVIYGFS